MNLCSSCGTLIEGTYCTKCGIEVEYPRVSSSQAEGELSGSAASKSRRSFGVPAIWLGLGIIAGIIVVFIATLVIRKTGSDAGQSSEKAFQGSESLKFEIEVQGSENRGSTEFHSVEAKPRGNAAASQLPEWVPTYPGAEITGMFGVQAETSDSGSAAFKTHDSEENVASFYENVFGNAGFKIKKNVTRFPGHGSMIMLTAENTNTKQTVHMTAARAERITTINLVFEAKR